MAAFARDYVAKKSRALSPTETPRIQPLYVERRIQTVFNWDNEQPEHIDRLPLEQLVLETTRLLVWGDLGTGKSTLIGSFVEQVNSEGEILAFLVPAEFLIPVPSTPLDLLGCISRFIQTTFLLDHDRYDVRDVILKHQNLVTFAIDGLDEIDNRTARRLFDTLHLLLLSFPSLRLVVTSRIVGNEYSLGTEWLQVTISPLNEAERFQLLADAAAASGQKGNEAEAVARSVIERLRADAALDEAARSPLELRLLFQELQSMDAHRDGSIGTMLYQLLLQRLHKWEDAEATKHSPTPSFCADFPSADSRLEVLSILANAISEEELISIERAEFLFRNAPMFSELSEVTVVETLKFFEWTNIIRITNGRVIFVLRPLLEMACASAIVVKLKNQESVSSMRWHVVAFSAAIARVRGQLDELRPALMRYVDALKAMSGWIIPACYIAAESRDVAISKNILNQHTRYLERPLFALEQERRTSAMVIAMTIHLAGDEGFEWFYARYINPKYPVLHYGSYLPESIFENWIGLHEDTYSRRQLELLATIPASHLATRSPMLHRLVPMAVWANPSSVSTRTRAGLLPSLLTHSSLARRAMMQLRQLQNVDHIQDVLWTQILRGNENAAQCAELWLDRERQTLPPPQVISIALRARGNWNARFFSQPLWDELITRLGPARWGRFCRWQTSSESAHDAVGAALYLSSQRPEEAGDFRDIFLRALHDGNPSRESESTLARILDNDPVGSARWLSQRIGEYRGPMEGTHSGWWRLFLPLLRAIGTIGPVMLSGAIRGVGPFLLSRNADIRHRIRELIRTPEKALYIDMLHEKLRRGTTSERYGAAQFLICLRYSIGEALLVCARARMDYLSRSWEWDRYCTSLRFPEDAIDYILAAKDALAPLAKLFVLAITASHGRPIASTDMLFLVKHIDWTYSLPSLESALTEAAAFPLLLNEVLSPDSRPPPRAARFLLERHLSQLDEQQRIRCEIIAYDQAALKYDRDFYAFETEPLQRAAVIQVGRELAKEYGYPFAIPALAEASADIARWDDALHALFSNKSIGNESELVGWALLVIGAEFPSHGDAIGRAARRICERAREGGKKSSDEVLWLALLAHEFGALRQDEILDLVNPYDSGPRLCSVNAALVARLSEMPPIVDAPAESAPLVTEASLDDLTQAVRDAGGILQTVRDESSVGKKLCGIMERALYLEHESADFEQLAASGTGTRLLSAVFQYLYNYEVDPVWLLGITATEWHRSAFSNSFHGRLRNLALFAFARTRREHQDDVRRLLGLEIQDSNGGLVAGMLVASAGWSLTTSELSALISRYSEHPYYGWRPVLKVIVNEMIRVLDSAQMDESIRLAVAQSLDRFVIVHERLDTDPLGLLLYGIFGWLLDITGDTASSVFRRGLSYLLLPAENENRSRERGIDVMAETVSLLKRVDPMKIRMSLTQVAGEESDVMAVALLISSFVETAPTLTSAASRQPSPGP